MKIQCVLIREGGTHVEIDNTRYHFEPLPDGAHVADVERRDHIDRFLSIGEAYKLYHGELAPQGAPEKIKPVVVSDPTDLRVAGAATTPTVGLLGSSVHDSVYEIGDALYQLGDIVGMAYEKSGLSADDWNALEVEDRHARIDVVLDELADKAEAAAATPPAADDPAAERAALVEQYRAKFGKAPHYRLSIENLKAALAAE